MAYDVYAIYSDSDSDSVTPPTGLSGEFGHTCSTGARRLKHQTITARQRPCTSH